MRALFVDDEVEFLELMHKRLSRRGMDVVTAPDGQTALELVSQAVDSGAEPFNIVIMDVRMPVMDGLKAAKMIRSLERPDAKSIPIIAMSANAFDNDVNASLGAGMNAHLAKPVDPLKLFQTLAVQIAKRKE